MITAVLDHLWQSTLFVVCAGLLTLMLHNNGAHSRYWLWFAASAKFLLPFSLLVVVGNHLVPPHAAAITVPPAAYPAATVVQQAAQPFSFATPVLTAPAASGLSLVPILFALWAVGFAAVLLVWLVRWMRINAALRSATPLPLAAPIPVKSSSSFLEPGLVGIWRPVLLLPEGIAARLSSDEMQTILAHELCHLRRRDNLTASIHMLVEALFWFYPLVWWLGARMINERERACDESVVEADNDPQVYAEGILKVCRFYVHSPLDCAAGVSGADLKKRVETIMTNRIAIRLNAVKKFLLATTAAAAIAVPVCAGLFASPQAIAQTQSAAVAPTPAEVAQRFAEQAQVRTAIVLDPKLFDKFVGKYEFESAAVLTVTRDGEHFMAQLTGQPAAEIFPENQTKFFYKVVAAQISFVADPQGKVTGLVLHQGGYEQTAKRIEDAVANSIAAAMDLRIKNNTASPGTEAYIRRYIASLEKGQPDFSEMSPLLADAARQQSAYSEQTIKKLGAFKSITFKGVGHYGGWDVYTVSFEHGDTEWRIAPIPADGKVLGLTFRELP